MIGGTPSASHGISGGAATRAASDPASVPASETAAASSPQASSVTHDARRTDRLDRGYIATAAYYSEGPYAVGCGTPPRAPLIWLRG
ncbi:MAG: hypothetical protein DRJ42_12040 [Deltaproteobacteria bacterium]|nr:MAG: hypothetical protein DRJ42_12040 [Deltaproteobacteria bacterium]